MAKAKSFRFSDHFYFWVLLGILVGGCIGFISPRFGTSLKPLGDGFIALIKMLIGPIVFCTVVLGIAGAGDMKKVGRVGGKALLYFEVASTLALIIGLIVGHGLKPGAGFHVNPDQLAASEVLDYTRAAEHQTMADFLLRIIPKTFIDAFSGSGDLLQILLISVLFGYSLNRFGKKNKVFFEMIESASQIFFGMIKVILNLAPIGAGGAMAFTIGKYGVKSLWPLAYLMMCFYLTCLSFIFIVLGVVARMTGFSILKFMAYIREELLMVLGTSSSESALVPLMDKLERLGCSRSVVGLVVPAGYSFNLDGTNIYLTLSVLFISQAMGIDLSWTDQLSVLGVAMLTSKGASGVTGAGFVALAATLAVLPKVPAAGLTLILGIDRFMSEARSITNIIGNGVATLVVSAWEGELNRETLKRELG
jgi:aerobic C4-dicarboxylate transport protein